MRRASGFTLIEVVIAVLLLAIAALGIAQSFALATMSVLNAREQTFMTLLACQKLEQLRALTWSYRRAVGTGVDERISDFSTDLSVDPPAAGGGGLRRSPPDSLIRDTPGLVDYIDARGRWIGTGASPPAGTVYVRRWSIEPFSSAPDDLLVLRVVTVALRREVRRTSDGSSPAFGAVRLVTLKARKGS